MAYDVRGGIFVEPSRPAGVQFKIDGVKFGSEQTTAYSTNPLYSVYRLPLDTRTLSNGTHAITAVARDWAGNTSGSPAVYVVVRN